MQFSETCEKKCGRAVFLEELQAVKNFSKVFLHFQFCKTNVGNILRNMHFFCATRKVLQKQLTKIDLKVPEKCCDEIINCSKLL